MEFSLAIKLECVNIFLSSTDTKQKVTVIIIMSTIKRNVFGVKLFTLHICHVFPAVAA